MRNAALLEFSSYMSFIKRKILQEHVKNPFFIGLGLHAVRDLTARSPVIIQPLSGFSSTFSSAASPSSVLRVSLPHSRPFPHEPPSLLHLSSSSDSLPESSSNHHLQLSVYSLTLVSDLCQTAKSELDVLPSLFLCLHHQHFHVLDICTSAFLLLNPNFSITSSSLLFPSPTCLLKSAPILTLFSGDPLDLLIHLHPHISPAVSIHHHTFIFQLQTPPPL